MSKQQFDSTTDELLLKGDLKKFCSCDDTRCLTVYSFYLDKENRIYGGIGSGSFENDKLVSIELWLHNTECPAMAFQNPSCSNLKKLLSIYQGKYGNAKILKEETYQTTYEWQNGKNKISFRLSENPTVCVGFIDYSLNNEEIDKTLKKKLNKEI